MISTIRDYDPDKPHMAVTLAWDETQKHVSSSPGLAPYSRKLIVTKFFAVAVTIRYWPQNGHCIFS